jgi:hypothetical protein
MNDIEDQRLRDQLTTADPAAGLDVLSGAARSAVLERVLEQDPTGTVARRPANRRGIRLGVGILALASAAVAVTALLLPMHPGGLTPRVLALRAQAVSSTGLCLRLDDFAPDALAASSIALEGTVTNVSEGAVQVRPDRFFRGGPADRVDLTSARSTVEDATVFHPGERVLIAAAGKDVIGCGLSGEASRALRTYYDAAFSR